MLLDLPVPGGEVCFDCCDRVDAIAAVVGRAQPMQPPVQRNRLVYRCPTCATLLTEALRDLAVAGLMALDDPLVQELLTTFQEQREGQRHFVRALTKSANEKTQN